MVAAPWGMGHQYTNNRQVFGESPASLETPCSPCKTVPTLPVGHDVLSEGDCSVLHCGTWPPNLAMLMQSSASSTACEKWPPLYFTHARNINKHRLPPHHLSSSACGFKQYQQGFRRWCATVHSSRWNFHQRSSSPSKMFPTALVEIFLAPRIYYEI